MGKIEPEKEIKKVVICYEDGEEKEMKQGFFCETQPGEECLNLTFHMFQVEGKELVCIVEGMMELGDRLGMFSATKETQEGEKENRGRKRSQVHSGRIEGTDRKSGRRADPGGDV